MVDTNITALNKAVACFRRYQQDHFPKMTEELDNGEWVFGDEFDDMCRAYMAVLNNVPSSDTQQQLLDDMIYAVARDSECSDLVAQTLDFPDWFAVLCEYSMKTECQNAKWQFAKYLCEYKGTREIAHLIFDFLDSGDEYTERMALRSLAQMDTWQAEKYAVLFWERNKYAEDEYQKIMALYALDKASSPLLEEYLAKAEQSPYQYLKKYADGLRGKSSDKTALRAVKLEPPR